MNEYKYCFFALFLLSTTVCLVTWINCSQTLRFILKWNIICINCLDGTDYRAAEFIQKAYLFKPAGGRSSLSSSESQALL